MLRMRYVNQALSGWGRFPVEACHVYRPTKRSEVSAILHSGAEPSYIPRGLGRSYGDAALNLKRGTILFTHLNRFLSFDPAAGILECEAGVSFAEIIHYLLPRGFFPPVTPGTKYATVGGAIAADIHGKNHHRDGSLANFVVGLRLLTPEGQLYECSANRNSEVFWATVGGMGLTGIILSAEIALHRVESAYLVVDYRKTRSLDETLAVMEESDAQHRYSVAWIDALARGRSVLMRADHAAASELPRHLTNPLAIPKRVGLRVPFDFPSLVLNRRTVRCFNRLYYALHRSERLLTDVERYFYPLDRIDHWNRAYGKRGFLQYQVALPLDGGREALQELVRCLADFGAAPGLAVLKRFGVGNAAPLGFPIQGYTLALDMPDSRDLVPFLHQLDQRVAYAGGRVYLAKDAVLRPETFARMYPRLDEFRSIKSRLDPHGRLSSSLARRLRIVDDTQ